MNINLHIDLEVVFLSLLLPGIAVIPENSTSSF